MNRGIVKRRIGDSRSGRRLPLRRVLLLASSWALAAGSVRAQVHEVHSHSVEPLRTLDSTGPYRQEEAQEEEAQALDPRDTAPSGSPGAPVAYSFLGLRAVPPGVSVIRGGRRGRRFRRDGPRKCQAWRLPWSLEPPGALRLRPPQGSAMRTWCCAPSWGRSCLEQMVERFSRYVFAIAVRVYRLADAEAEDLPGSLRPRLRASRPAPRRWRRQTLVGSAHSPALRRSAAGRTSGSADRGCARAGECRGRDRSSR